MKYLISFLIIIGFQVSAQTVDATGKKQGYWKKKDEKTNKLVYEGLFKDNKPQGVFKYYYPNDTLKAKMDFRKDGAVSYSTLYHPTGKKMAVGKYINELKDSVWIYYDDKGVKISDENFVLGKKNGKSRVYTVDGILSEEHNYKNDIKDGPFKKYFNKTQVKGEGTYVNGELDGRNAYYYPNGTAAALGYYKNGLKIGPWIYKEMNGKVKEKELFKNGKLASKKETDEFFSKVKPEKQETKTPTNTESKPKKEKAKPAKK